ncbi:MAG: ergothioneine biosynthesis protein EgtB [Gemmatimonadota bacterium]
MERYHRVRRFTETLCEPLSTEDFVVQTMRDVSPTKWHLAHVSWFFETFILAPHAPAYEPLDPRYAYLFNSYYVQAGERHCRDQRGYLSRPTVGQVYEYRRYVDEHMERLLSEADEEALRELDSLVELGLNHEQQHQELLLTDIKHVLSVNPLRPAYRVPGGRDSLAAESAARPDGAAGVAEDGPAESARLEWIPFEEGLHWIGHEGDAFCYDNETPRHRFFVEPFLLRSRLVTNGEYLAFMDDGGYERPELWLSEGWGARQANEWTEPFYWERRDGRWYTFTLAGLREVVESEPVCHLSYFEADAFARWAGARLPTEQEWEVAAASVPLRGNFVESGRLHPAPLAAGVSMGPPDAASGPASGPSGVDTAGPQALLQMYGDVWEWTRSQYSPYSGYEPLPGAIGEYNGKFMSNQFVLRGGSCATSRTHIRPTYRNFFPADATWQFMGCRLARDVR